MPGVAMAMSLVRRCPVTGLAAPGCAKQCSYQRITSSRRLAWAQQKVGAAPHLPGRELVGDREVSGTSMRLCQAGKEVLYDEGVGIQLI